MAIIKIQADFLLLLLWLEIDKIILKLMLSFNMQRPEIVRTTLTKEQS